MASESIVRIVINAVDKYSGVLTGLNQGLELVSKAFTGLSTVAVGSFNAIKTGLDSVAEGGDFLELRRQYESLAQSFGKSGEQILRTFQDVSGGVLNATDSIKLASKAISSGLTNPEIEAAVKYTKRWSEATGEDFASLSERVFEAFNSGKFAILKQMGLLIDKTTSASDVLRQMEQNMGVFSDTGLNVGDSLNAIASAIDDFVLFSRAAIANSDTLSQALDYVATSARDFVRSFDFEVVTQFFDTLLRASQIVYRAVAETFSGIGESIFSVFEGLRTKGGIKEFFQALGEYSATAYKAFSIFADGVADSTTLVIGAFGNMVKLSGQGFQELKYLAASAIAKISEVVNTGVAGWAKSILDFVQSSPDVAAFVPGIDAVSNAMVGLIKSSAASKKTYDEFRDSILTEDSVGKTVEGWGQSMEDFAISLDQSRAKAKQTGEELFSNLEKGFKDFEVSPRKPFISDEIINKTSEQGEKLQELLRKQRDIRDEDESKATTKRLEAQEKKEIAAAEKARKRQEDALRQTLRDIEDLENRISKNTFNVLSVDESQLLASKDKIKAALAEIDAESKRQNLSLALDVATDPRKIQQLKGEIDKLGIKDGKLTIKADTDKQQPIPVAVSLQGGPTFFRELIQSAIVELKGERVPLVFTAVPA